MINNETEFLHFAFHAYDNPQCISIVEFEQDLAKFTYIKKLLYKYLKDKDINERLIVNHIITIYNVFGNAATTMLFYKMERQLWQILITFLVYIKRMPDALPEYGIDIKDYPIDEFILGKLINT